MVSEPKNGLRPSQQPERMPVHSEATAQLELLLLSIRKLGKKVGVSIKPETPLIAIERVLNLVIGTYHERESRFWRTKLHRSLHRESQTPS